MENQEAIILIIVIGSSLLLGGIGGAYTGVKVAFRYLEGKYHFVPRKEQCEHVWVCNSKDANPNGERKAVCRKCGDTGYKVQN